MHLENEEMNPSSHKTFPQLHTWELGNIQTSRLEEISYDLSKVLDQQSYHNQSLEFENQSGTGKVNVDHHFILHLTIINDDFSLTLLDSISSSQVSDYEEFNPYQIDQDINHNVEKTLEFEFKKIEFEFHDLFKRHVYLQDDVHMDKNLQEALFNFEFPSHDSLHKALAHDCHDIYFSLPYSFEQSYFINHTYYDRIADWLERSFLAKFPENGKMALILFFESQNGKSDLFIFGFKILQFLLLIIILFDFAGLKLLRWLH